MRQVHRAGEKCSVDYAGQKPRLVDPATGEIVPVELFVASSGPPTTPTPRPRAPSKCPDWIASHTRAFAYFGGVTSAVVPDQLKSGVVVPCRYEPGLQRTYEEFAALYGAAILPARPAKPRDKGENRGRRADRRALDPRAAPPRGLGKLYRRIGKRQDADEHLTTATTMYRDMDMRFWLEKTETFERSQEEQGTNRPSRRA